MGDSSRLALLMLRSPPPTWPSSGRPSRSWRRSRSAPSLPPSSKPCQIPAQDDKKICHLGNFNFLTPSVKIQKLAKRCPNYYCASQKPFLSPLIFSSNPIWFSGTLISVSSPTININHYFWLCIQIYRYIHIAK